MIDIKLIRTNPELVKENIKKKFQDDKLELVNKVIELDKQYKNVDHYGDGAWLVWDGEHMGYIDCTGKIIVPCKYYAYNPFSEGLAALQDKQNGKWGFVDKEGKSTFDYQ